MNQPSNAPVPGAAPRYVQDPAVLGTAGQVKAKPTTEGDWKDFQAAVRRILDTESQAALGHAGAGNSRFAQLWCRLGDSLLGGKLTRPRLVLLSYSAFGGSNRQAAAILGAAFEMLHSALLIHDDVIDQDLVRRGRPTVGALYRQDALDLGHAAPAADHVGNSAALIGGDILLAGSVRLAARAGSATGTAEDVLDVMNAAVLAAAAGELDDLVYSLGGLDIDIDQVLDMERLKTASYSFEAPLRAGAVLAGAPASSAERMGAIGRTLGIAYQVIDDVLGTFGDPAITGKSIESDLRSDKKTILGALAAHDGSYLAAHAAYHRGEAGVEDVRAALKAAGAEDAARGLAHRLVRRALADAADLAPATTLADDLADICTFILERDK